MKNTEIKIFSSGNWHDLPAQTGYELLDTGEGEKLERFGKYTFVRPYEGAVWKKTLPLKDWAEVDGKFWSSKTGAKAGWKLNKEVPKKWEMSYEGVNFWALPTPFRHLAFFPEQAPHWDFIEKQIKSAGRPIKFLNLFGYTGVASLFALRGGADVTHVDASKQILTWVKDNQELSGMEKMPMRIIPEDAIKFLEREIKRGNKYDAVIMDPPKFGRGPKGETWKIEEDLGDLLSKVTKVLSNKPLFVVLTSYAIDASSLSLGNALTEATKDLHGVVTQGELCVTEKSKERIISLANTAVWSSL
ncbi:MAG: class I SAM-dependent methyltransferase [Candidatus Pacebacteria bacterium]|nr:class I SAM-dependent methyltransferase [Candidatus Paceibacterota bacterium]